MLNCLRIESFQSRHDRAVLENLRSKNLIPALPALEAQLKRGPPPFLRPGWVSPLQGKQVDLEWLDQPGAFAAFSYSSRQYKFGTFDNCN